MIIHGFTLEADGRIRSHRQHDSSSLEPATVEFLAQMLHRCGPDFQHAIPVDGMEHIELYWTQQRGAAIATFDANGMLLTTSVLLAADGGEDGLEVAQTMLAEFSPFPMTRDLSSIKQRPVIITIHWPTVPGPDMLLVAHVEMCLAAAFFGVK